MGSPTHTPPTPRTRSWRYAHAVMPVRCTCDAHAPAHAPAMRVRELARACVQYRWETAEQDAVERRVVELDKAS